MKILARSIKTRRLVSSVFGNRDYGYVIEEQNGISSLCVEFCRLFVFSSYYVTLFTLFAGFCSILCQSVLCNKLFTLFMEFCWLLFSSVLRNDLLY